MKELFELFLCFAKIGLFTFGGGYAMMPMIQRELVENRKWVTEGEVMDYFAISNITPGVIAVNTATFIGYKRKGIAGGIVATLGVVFPSIVIITAIAALITNFAHIYAVQCAFAGIRTAVLAMIIKTLWTMIKKGVKDIFTLILMIATFCLMLTDVSVVLVVIGAALVGIVYKEITERTKKGGADR